MDLIHPHTWTCRQDKYFPGEVKRYSISHKCPYLAQKLFPLMIAYKGKIRFLQQSHWVCKPYLRPGSMPSKNNNNNNNNSSNNNNNRDWCATIWKGVSECHCTSVQTRNVSRSRGQVDTNKGSTSSWSHQWMTWCPYATQETNKKKNNKSHFKSILQHRW